MPSVDETVGVTCHPFGDETVLLRDRIDPSSSPLDLCLPYLARQHGAVNDDW